jgi:hypothetical protein
LATPLSDGINLIHLHRIDVPEFCQLSMYHDCILVRFASSSDISLNSVVVDFKIALNLHENTPVMGVTHNVGLSMERAITLSGLHEPNLP